MNQERIAELTKQAYSKAQFNAEMKSKDFDRPEALDIWNEFPEVFAELIVRECLGVVKSNTHGPCGPFDYSYTNEDAAADERAYRIYQDITQNFGVANEQKN